MIFCCPSIDFQATITLFHSKLLTFRFFAHVHAQPSHHHPGCHCPPNSTGTPLIHLLAQCHQPHSTFPSMSPGVTLMSTFMHMCTPDLGSTIHQGHHCSFPVDSH